VFADYRLICTGLASFMRNLFRGTSESPWDLIVVVLLWLLAFVNNLLIEARPTLQISICSQLTHRSVEGSGNHKCFILSYEKKIALPRVVFTNTVFCHRQIVGNLALRQPTVFIARNSEPLWAERIIHDLYPVNQAIVCVDSIVIGLLYHVTIEGFSLR
jgi:hypothetical protein